MNDNDAAVSLPGHVSHCATLFAYCSTLAQTQTQAKVFFLFAPGYIKSLDLSALDRVIIQFDMQSQAARQSQLIPGIAFEGGKYYGHGLAIWALTWT